MKENKNTTFVIGALLGGTVGTIVTLLLTPRNGKENRKIVQKTVAALPEIAEDVSSTLQSNTNRLSHSALKKWDNTLNRLQSAIVAGIEASQNYNANKEDESKRLEDGKKE